MAREARALAAAHALTGTLAYAKRGEVPLKHNVFFAALSLTVVLAAACSGGGGGDAPKAARDQPFKADQTLGRIDRLAGGTAVPVDVRTMLTAECTQGQLRVRTNLELITASMNCDQMLPISVTERFFGKPVAITYRNERLIVENEVAGTLEFPAKDPRIKASDATP